jgi:serine/threonine-protein kinase RsbW
VRFCLVFEREVLSIPVMRQVLGDTLRGIGLNEESVTDILLAATAYTVAATVDDGACRVEVTDAGRGCRAPGAKRRRGSSAHGAAEGSPPDRETRDHGGLAESGRGFAIMSACVDEVTLRSAPGRGTHVVLDKRVAWSPPLARSA